MSEAENCIYMERNARLFLCAWPDVPEALEPVIERFITAGMITKPGAAKKYPWDCELTEAGSRLKVLVDSQSFNMFLKKDVQAIFYGQDKKSVARIFQEDLPQGARGLTTAETNRGGLHAAIIGLEIQIEYLIEAMKERKRL